ncbi:unnamed protein product [Cylicocyclus nassatus]|uniref:Saposin B-type domain-containing protein n=1 Tax=Cylicocyclus nassatus TaxID=53992 RepID=A0AA36DU59_CYLNA|nr:unnamed protein product [Cylicocyclus nassatus]
MKLLLALLAVIVLAEGWDLPTCDTCKKWIDYMREHVITAETDLDEKVDEFCTTYTLPFLTSACKVLLKENMPFILEKMKEHLESQEVCAAIKLC